MTKKMVHLVIPQKLIKEPMIYDAAMKYNVIPNIRRANVTETVGEITLELSGTDQALEELRKHLEAQGVKFEPIVGDIIE